MAISVQTKPKRKPQEMDRLRARALKGDPLKALRDTEREWVWRSLLKRVRWKETLKIAGLTEEQALTRLERVRVQYQRRIDAYKATKATEAQQPKVVRPVPPAQAPQRRGLWLFGKRR